MRKLFIALLFALGSSLLFSEAADQGGEIQTPSSEYRISVEELENWDEIVRSLLAQSPLSRKGDAYRLYAYLYYGQKLFSDRSFLLTNLYSGTLDSISLKIVNLFYPEFKPKNMKRDRFSEELAQTLMQGLQKRFEKEQKQIAPLDLPEKEGLWKDQNPVGLHYPSMEPWVLSSPDEFQVDQPPAPDDPFWKKQLEETQKKSRSATDLQKQKSLFWERKIDPEAADWRYIATQYMQSASIPLEMQLEVRAKVMMALIDALIAVFHDKYTYRVKRPYMLDPKTKTLFDTPRHPSYPAAHGTMSAAAETVLSYYFPENQREWNFLGYDARESRLWGGIHFPIDLESGQKQGQKVGKAVLFRTNSK